MSDEIDNPPTDADPLLRLVRPLYQSIFADLTLSDAVELSIEGTMALKRDREGFTYGETHLASLREILRLIDLNQHFPSGASLVDLGSGIGNVVVGTALLASAGALNGRIKSVTGVELLPTLHSASALSDVAGGPHGHTGSSRLM